MGSNWYSKEGLSSFDEVVKRYEETKPIRGVRANEDLRPLGRRAYWWKRIQKINDNTYALSDGHWAWSSVANQATITEQTAPIVWERKADGDYMTVRSHMNGGMSVSRYTFIDCWLPKGMRFIWPNGKHYITHEGKQHYLPKFVGKWDWTNKTFEMIDDRKVVFKHTADGFVRVNELQPFKTKRIDKEIDEAFAPDLKKLWDWATVTLPVLGETLQTSRHQYAEKLGGGSFWYWKRVDPAYVRYILMDEEHECRMALAVCLANEAGAVDGTGRFKESDKTFSYVRNAVRQVADFYLTEAR